MLLSGGGVGDAATTPGLVISLFVAAFVSGSCTTSETPEVLAGSHDAGVEVPPRPDAARGPSDAGFRVDAGLRPPARDSGPPEPEHPDRVAEGVVIEAPFDDDYRAYEIGPLPGVPSGRYGGCVVRPDDPDTLIIGFDSESPTGALYEIGLT